MARSMGHGSIGLAFVLLQFVVAALATPPIRPWAQGSAFTLGPDDHGVLIRPC